jgi:predicted AlkP superfamily pyrophosphatase or phosphodiesterase
MKLKSIFAQAGKLANLLVIAFVLLQLAAPVVAQPRRRQAVNGSAGKVIYVSFDGLAYHMWQNDPATRELHTIRRIASRGVTARGMIQAFPSITPASHAALWTGVYGNVSGIITSWTPMLPRSEHTPFDLKSGFSAELLRAEPIWAAAARQGVKVVAHQATQNYPFVPITTAQGASLAPVLASGYGPEEIETDASLRPKDVTVEDLGHADSVRSSKAD